MILVPIDLFLTSRNPVLPFVLIYDLGLSRSWPLQNNILGHILVTDGQNIAKF